MLTKPRKKATAFSAPTLNFNPVASTVPFIVADKFASFIVGPYGPVSGDTEFLTRAGWKRVDEYAPGDEVAQWHPDGQLEWVQPLDYIVSPASELLEFRCGKLKMCLSPCHRVPYYDYRGRFKEALAGDIAEAPSIRHIPSTFSVDNAVGLPMSDAVLRLAVAVNADGHFPPRCRPTLCYVTVRKERKKERLRALLEAAELEWQENTYSSRPTETRFVFDTPYMGKRFTTDWYQASSAQLAVILDECVHWDGSTSNGERLFFSAHERDATFIQYAAHACGGGATISKTEYPSKPGWRSSFRVHIAKAGSPKAHRQVSTHNAVINRVPAVGGRQYCFSTPSTYFLARYKGSVFVTGNSTKTTAGLMKIAYEAAQVAPCSDGIRRSRYAVVRNCFDPETEIFTEKGWVRFAELDPTTAVAALHGDEMKFEVPSFHYAAPYRGRMVGLKNQAVDLLVTPDHNLWVSERRGRDKVWSDYRFMQAKDAYGKGGTLRMRTTAANPAEGTQYSEAFYEFLGFWFAEGCAGVYPREDCAGEHIRLVLSQNPRGDRYVEKLLGRNGLRYSTHTKPSGNMNYTLSVADPAQAALARELAACGKARTKRVPRKYLEGASRAQARAFLYGYQQGDGTFKVDAHGKDVLRTASSQLKDDICEFAVLAGRMAVPSFYKHSADCADGYNRAGWWDIVLFGEKKYRPLVAKNHWYDVENYDGMVYCVEVSTHVVLVRRNGKAVWCSQTRQMLFDTTIPDFLKWFPDGEFGSFMKSESKYILKFSDVECEVLFRGLDDANDVRRLLSLQLTGGLMDEFREIHPDIYEALAGRVGRYPDKVLVPPRPEWGDDEKGNPIGGCVRADGKQAKRLWGMSNPPDMDTFWEQLLTNPPENAHVTLQPSGVSEKADWIHLLDSNYYENLMELHASDQDWIDVYVHSQFGKSLAGKPVFRGFSREFHVAEGLTPIISDEHPLIIGLDFGLTPACTISQSMPDGRFLTFRELVSDGMGILRFSREMLKPLLANEFPGHPVIIVGDPAGRQRAQTDEKTVYDVLAAEGFTAIPAITNSITARIAGVEGLLAAQIDGKARHLIDSRCKMLINGLAGGYRFKVKTNGEVEPKPDKNFYSHTMDGHQYACLHVDGMLSGGRLRRQGRREVVQASVSGWV